MDIAERAAIVEHKRGAVMTKSRALGELYARLGCTPAGLSMDDHIGVIIEDNFKSMDEAAYGGAMTWLQAADLALAAMQDILDGDANG